MPSRRPHPPVLQLLRSVLHRTKLIDAAVGVFLGLIGMAMAVYPGGTWWDPSHRRHHFWENFLCDLLHRRTLGGHPNLVSSRLSSIGMLVLALGMVVAFSLAPEVIPSRRRLGRAIAWLGSLGTLCLAIAALLPSDVYPGVHSIPVIAGGIPTLLAFAALVGALLLEPETTRVLRAVSILLLVSAVTSLLLYAWNVLFHGPSLRILPGIERVATIFLLGWLLLVARFVRFRLFTAYMALARKKQAPPVPS